MSTTRFGNGAEKVRKITVTKPDAMAARKKDKAPGREEEKPRASTTFSTGRMRTNAGAS